MDVFKREGKLQTRLERVRLDIKLRFGGEQNLYQKVVPNKAQTVEFFIKYR